MRHAALEPDLTARLDEHVIDSELLRGNPLSDANERPLWVDVPGV